MREARVNDTVVRYQQSGKGPVALFLHGFPLDHSMWQFQWEDLSEVRTCVVPDLRGFGASATPGPELLTMDQHALDMMDLLDHLGADRADIVGLSMGGYVALALWQHADRRLFDSWMAVERAEILDDQHADGSWSSKPFGSCYATAMNCLVLALPQGLLPIFQR